MTAPPDLRTVEDLLADLAPQVLGALVRRFRDLGRCEDGLQEAMITAVERWPRHGLPANPRGWLVTVAARRVTDGLRSDGARRDRERRVLLAEPVDPTTAPPSDEATSPIDDTLLLLVLCAHPDLTPASQMALTLRSVGGLSTEEIAAAFLVPVATMTRRLSRARQTVDAALAREGSMGLPDLPGRLPVVCQVLYLVFNEGYVATSGPELQRRDLATEAIRLTRLLHRLVPDDAEVAGLLALMLLTDARTAARTGPGGMLVPLAEQDRARWDRAMIAEGTELLLRTLPKGRLGPYQLQAAIAAVHDEAASVAETDWVQILALHRLLDQVAPDPVRTLNRVVAEAEVHGPDAGFALLDDLVADPRIADHHRVAVVRAHLHERRGDRADAERWYREAARRATSTAERNHLLGRAAAAAADPSHDPVTAPSPSSPSPAPSPSPSPSSPSPSSPLHPRNDRSG